MSYLFHSNNVVIIVVITFFFCFLRCNWYSKNYTHLCLCLNEFGLITFWIGLKPSPRDTGSCWVQPLLTEFLWRVLITPRTDPYYVCNCGVNWASFYTGHTATIHHVVRDPQKCFNFDLFENNMKYEYYKEFSLDYICLYIITLIKYNFFSGGWGPRRPKCLETTKVKIWPCVSSLIAFFFAS